MEVRLRRLSTGEAARLLSVKPDTVLKWIKRGRLAAARTAGGHYRIDSCDIERLVIARDEGVGRRETKNPYCWEYYSRDGQMRDACAGCVVYRVQAALCSKMLELVSDTGHAKQFCRTTCEDCAYYQQVHQLPMKVLVVTGDTPLSEALRTAPESRLTLRFAANAYTASALVAAFRPAVVAVDQKYEDGEHLVGWLANDERIPGARVIFIERPFHLEQFLMRLFGAG
jgi:excisionase family DNA binding protein